MLSLERERQPEIQERTLDGPSLGWRNHEKWQLQWIKTGECGLHHLVA
ncbi:hypothetical protein [Escherichia coli]|nr:hypothetical protein [Escherichia coli]